MWAYAWIEYLFYDSDLFYSVLQNKNYEMPTPPINYTFKSGVMDEMLQINVFHAVIIRSYYTHFKDDAKQILKPKDLLLLQASLSEEVDLDDTMMKLVENKCQKIISTILKNPQSWKQWLELFQDENIYEETVPQNENKERRLSKTHQRNASESMRELSSIHQVSVGGSPNQQLGKESRDDILHLMKSPLFVIPDSEIELETPNKANQMEANRNRSFEDLIGSPLKQTDLDREIATERIELPDKTDLRPQHLTKSRRTNIDQKLSSKAK